MVEDESTAWLCSSVPPAPTAAFLDLFGAAPREIPFACWYIFSMLTWLSTVLRLFKGSFWSRLLSISKTFEMLSSLSPSFGTCYEPPAKEGLLSSGILLALLSCDFRNYGLIRLLIEAIPLAGTCLPIKLFLTSLLIYFSIFTAACYARLFKF